MDKRTPNKRKSLANTETTPTKVQKHGNTPVSQKKNNKSPKFANKNKKTPQKQLNGKQNTPKEKKKSKKTEDNEPELLNEEEENESKIEQAVMSSGDDDSDSEEHDKSGDEAEEDDDEDEKSNTKKTHRKYSVYIGGLTYETSKNDVRGFFDNESILSIVLLKNKFNNKPRGIGFVNFKDEAAMMKALSKHGSQLNGREVKVQVAENKNTRQDQLNITEDKKKALIIKQLQEKIKKLENEMKGKKKSTFQNHTKNKAAKKQKHNKKEEQD